ncbi:MAG: hypothetical protein Q9207_007337 [Kuettlingeria erythrocarpa]
MVVTFALSALAMPTNLQALTPTLLPRGAEGEPFTCPDPSGTAAAKKALLNAGAQTVDIAIAMLENGCAFHAAFSAGNNKKDDSAELGVYRNNWHMIRTHCDGFKGAGPGEWYSRGQEIHNDVALATRCQRQLWDQLGPQQYFSLQRGGLGNPGAGAEYGNYVEKYRMFCESDGGVHKSDGICTYWNVASM